MWEITPGGAAEPIVKPLRVESENRATRDDAALPRPGQHPGAVRRRRRPALARPITLIRDMRGRPAGAAAVFVTPAAGDPALFDL